VCACVHLCMRMYAYVFCIVRDKGGELCGTVCMCVCVCAFMYVYVYGCNLHHHGQRGGALWNGVCVYSFMYMYAICTIKVKGREAVSNSTWCFLCSCMCVCIHADPKHVSSNH
jgi:hypothetical protein